MRSTSISAILVLIFGCSAFAQTPQRIGLVHVADAMAKISEGKRVTQAVAARQAAAQQDRAQRVKELQDMEGELGQLKRGSPQYNDLLEKFQSKQDEYETWMKRTNRTLAQATKRDYQQMYDHIREATKEIARQRQLTLVINETALELGANADQISPEQFGAALAQRPLVFADDSIDITMEVVTKADANLASVPMPATPGK